MLAINHLFEERYICIQKLKVSANLDDRTVQTWYLVPLVTATLSQNVNTIDNKDHEKGGLYIHNCSGARL